MLVDPCISNGYVVMFGSLDSCHDRAAASVIHCMPQNSLQASVCVFSDCMMAHQHLESVVVRKKKSEGWAALFHVVLCHHSSTIKAELIMTDLM